MTSTPEGYATPDQISQAQQLSALLMKGGHRDAPITSPWQGARMLADTLAGQQQSQHAGQQEMASRQYDNPESLAGPYSGPPTTNGRTYIPQQTPGDTSIDPQSPPQPQQHQTPPSNAYGGLPMPIVDKIRNQEGFTPQARPDVKQFSYGYGSKAPTPGATISRSGAEELLNRDLSTAAKMVDQVNPKLDPGTRAALTDLTFNAGIGWSKAGLGDAVRAGDPNAIKQHLLQYNQVAGQPNPGIAARRQMDAGWIGQPRAQVAQAGPVPQGGAQGAPQIPGLQGATQMAAGGHSPGAPGQPSPQMPPAGKAPVAPVPPGVQQGGPPDPSLYQGRPSISRDDYNRAMISPWVSEDRKKALTDIYLQQGQPLQFQTPTGTYTRSPGTGAEYFSPGLMQGEVSSGGSSYKGTIGVGTPQPGIAPLQGLGGALGIGGGQPTSQQPSSNTLKPIDGPSLEMPPVGGPPPPPPGTPGPQSANVPMRPGAQLAMLAPPQGGQPQGASPQGVPPQAMPPQGGTPPQQGAPPQGPSGATGTPPGAPPPGGTPPPPGMLGQGPPTPGMLSTPPPTKVAQQGGVGGLLGGLQQMDLDQERRKEFIKNDQKAYNDSYTAVTTAGKNAPAMVTQLNLADAALKKMYTGILAPQYQNLQRLKAALGGNPEQASAYQAFQKATSEAIAESLKSSFGGLGQIRNKEIELKEKAMGNVFSTPEANRVVLGLAKASAQQSQGMADIANRYSQGQRYQDGKWYQTQETPTNTGLQQLLLKYAQSHPIMSDADIDKAMSTLNSSDQEPRPLTSEGKPWQENSSGLPHGIQKDPTPVRR
jgi:GH24 family phage-related lysozyme (muramidase)